MPDEILSEEEVNKLDLNCLLNFGISRQEKIKIIASGLHDECGWRSPEEIEEKLCAASAIYSQASDKAFRDSLERATQRAAEQARIEERKAIGRWGNEECPHHVQADGTNDGTYLKRRNCVLCWQIVERGEQP